MATGFRSAMADKEEITKGSVAVSHYGKAEFPNLATLTLDEAAKIATDRIGGKLLGIQLENENGFLVYNAEIVTPGRSINEVKVDAGNGDVLAVEKDAPDPDDED